MRRRNHCRPFRAGPRAASRVPAPVQSRLPVALRHRAGGVTLIELLVVLAVVAVLLGLGVPSFRTLTERTRVNTAVQRLQGHLALARSEAVRRGLRVTACRSADGASCASSGGWEQGWIVFPDPGAQAQPAPGAPVLARGSALPPPLTLTGKGTLAAYVSFTEVGQPQSTTGALLSGAFTLCASPGIEGRLLVLSSAGRVRVGPPAGPDPCA